MKLVAQLRIKNQALTIKECLTKLSELVDEIVIVDNGSIDGTIEIYKEFPKIKKINHTIGFDEGRDKRLAHQLAKERKPDWILWIDGDEIFEDSTNRKQLESYMNDPNLNEVRFRMFNFWKSKTHFRIDGRWKHYTSQPQRQMWRNLPSAYFRDLKFHNGGIMGLPGTPITSYIRIKHYGYINPKQMSNKQATYNELKNDPMAKKTLPMNEKNIKLQKWLEFDNPILQKNWQYIEKYRWSVVSILILISKVPKRIHI